METVVPLRSRFAGGISYICSQWLAAPYLPYGQGNTGKNYTTQAPKGLNWPSPF